MTSKKMLPVTIDSHNVPVNCCGQLHMKESPLTWQKPLLHGEDAHGSLGIAVKRNMGEKAKFKKKYLKDSLHFKWE